MSNGNGQYFYNPVAVDDKLGLLADRVMELERKVDLLKEAFDSMNAGLEKVYEATMRFLEACDDDRPKEARWGSRG